MDGHIGLENNQINQGSSGDFELILSTLKQSSGDVTLVIHATSRTSSFSGLSRLDFLQKIGFWHFDGECKFFHDKCFFKGIGIIDRAPEGFLNSNQVFALHELFKRFSSEIGGLYEIEKRKIEVLGRIGLNTAREDILGLRNRIVIKEGDMPLWVNESKFGKLKELESERNRIAGEIGELNYFLPLLFASGDVLTNSVLKSLLLLGLKAVLTDPGFTIDIFSESQDGSKKFGFEVTGLNDSVKKENKKLTQLLEFERIKEHQEKTILVANTYNTRPIPQRLDLESFTTPVVEFLSPYPILLMTGWDLYRMIDDVLKGARNKEEIVETLYTSNGVLAY